jgi:hypothetical protein
VAAQADPQTFIRPFARDDGVDALLDLPRERPAFGNISRKAPVNGVVFGAISIINGRLRKPQA